jgi:hypothetical protein
LSAFAIFAWGVASGLALPAQAGFRLGEIAYDPSRQLLSCVETQLRVPIQNLSQLPMRRLEEIGELRLMTYNTKGLIETVGKYERLPNGRMQQVTGPRAIETERILLGAQPIRQHQPDFIFWQEAEGGLERLNTYTSTYLNDQYANYMIYGNEADRRINIGFSVKRDLPITVEARTHRDEMWKDVADDKKETVLFNRDLPVFLIRDRDAGSDSEPLMILIGTHNKSKRNRDGDRLSTLLRTAQNERAAMIVNRLKHEFGEHARIVVGGDFNTSLYSPEVTRSFFKVGLKEAFNAWKPDTPMKDRQTFAFIAKNRPRELNQLDGFYLAQPLQDKVTEVQVVHYDNRVGRRGRLPRTRSEREKNPSDHYPVLMKLDFRRIFKEWRGEK